MPGVMPLAVNLNLRFTFMLIGEPSNIKVSDELRRQNLLRPTSTSTHLHNTDFYNRERLLTFAFRVLASILATKIFYSVISRLGSFKSVHI